MKFRLVVSFGKCDSMRLSGVKDRGYRIRANSYSAEIRPRHDFEKADSYSGGERLHGWRDVRDGLWQDAFIPLPFGWCVDLSRNRMTYAEAVGCPPLSLDWILGEFDSSFNQLAIGSLKYHMDWSVCYCDDEQRERYSAMIARLSEPEPDTTPDEDAAIDTWDFLGGERSEDGTVRVPPCPQDARLAFDSWQERCDAHKERIEKARIEFVRDILPELWS